MSTAVPPPPLSTKPHASRSPWWRSLPVLLAVAFLFGACVGVVGSGGGEEPVASPETVTETVTAAAEPGEGQTVTETVTGVPVPAETVTEVVTEVVTEQAAAPATPAAPPSDTPPDAAAGTYTAGSYTFADIQVTADSGFVEGRARVTNNGQDTQSVVWTMTLLQGGSVVAALQGIASDFSAGSTITVQFIGVEETYAGHETVEFQVDSEF